MRTSRRSFVGGVVTGSLIANGVPGIAGTVLAAQPEADDEVVVFPPHGTKTASTDTEISFRGVASDALGTVMIVGSESGGHGGVYVPHSDGNGVSLRPDVPFLPGEAVTVWSEAELMGAVDGAVTFSVARPGQVPRMKERLETEHPETPPQELRSRPDLRPPVVTVTTPAAETAPGYVFFGAKIADGPQGAMVVDDLGELVWFHAPANAAEQHNDVRVQEYRGMSVLTLWEGISETGYGLGHVVMLDSSYQRVATLQVGNGFRGADLHEFLITPEGTALVVAYNPVELDLTSNGGSANGAVVDGIVQEIDIETGCVLFEWHSLDHVDVEESYFGVPEGGERHDYFHLNSIEDDGEGSLIISARNTHAVYKIDRRTGQVLWRLGGRRSDFSLGDGVRFAWQHDARVHANGELTLFDNAAASIDEGMWSRGMVLDVDEEAMTAALVREYYHPDDVFSGSQANMQALPNGNIFIGWGSAPVVSELGPDGDLRFNLELPAGGTSYRAYRFPWTGQPVDPPDIAVEAGASGATIYASWNGATEVASWRVIAGPTPETMEIVGELVPRDGFETTIPVTVDTAWYSVQAIDANGSVIGTAVALEPTSQLATPASGGG